MTIPGRSPGLKIEWAMLADYVSVDASGKLSIAGIFDRLLVPQAPAVHGVVYVAARWQGPPFEHVAAELRFWGPSNDLLIGAEQIIEFDDRGAAHTINVISPLVLPTLGQYVVEFLAGGVSQHNFQFAVEAVNA